MAMDLAPPLRPAKAQGTAPAQTQKSDTYRVECGFCGKMGNLNQMLICDICDTVAHTFCSKPPLDQVPSSGWLCPPCKGPKKTKDHSGAKMMPNLNHVTPQNMRGMPMYGGGLHARGPPLKQNASSTHVIPQLAAEHSRANATAASTQMQPIDIRHSEWRRYLSDAVSNTAVPQQAAPLSFHNIARPPQPNKPAPPPWPIGISARIRSIPRQIRENATRAKQGLLLHSKVVNSAVTAASGDSSHHIPPSMSSGKVPMYKQPPPALAQGNGVGVGHHGLPMWPM